MLFVDNLVIPSSASRPELAHRFIDYLMQPQVIAQVTAETLYPNGNADSAQFIDAALLAQPGLYPDQDTKRRLYPLEVLSDKHAQVRDQIWQRFRDGT